MQSAAWNRFVKVKEHYRSEIERLQRSLPGLQALQQKLVNGRNPSYPVETAVVYNSALDDIQPDSEIRLILVADNPGRREQAAENRRYLVGPSGKIAEKFFRDNPALRIDFRANVIILNKTPIHTPRTVELRELRKMGGTALETALDDSQRLMARLLREFQKALTGGLAGGPAGGTGTAPPVWICGYSEMKKNGVFEAYTAELKTIYDKSPLKDSVFLYRHFSMNQFTIDLKQKTVRGEPLAKTLNRIGTAYREKYLW